MESICYTVENVLHSKWIASKRVEDKGSKEGNHFKSSQDEFFRSLISTICRAQSLMVHWKLRSKYKQELNF